MAEESSESTSSSSNSSSSSSTSVSYGTGLDEAELLARFVRVLRSALGLNSRTCFEVLDAHSPPAIPAGGDWFVTVAPGDGQFNVEHQAAAGAEQLTERLQIIVTVFSRVRVDATDRETELLNNAARGLLPVARRILAAMTNHGLGAGGLGLRQTVHVLGGPRPAVWRSPRLPMGLATVQIVFGVEFDWSL